MTLSQLKEEAIERFDYFSGTLNPRETRLEVAELKELLLLAIDKAYAAGREEEVLRKKKDMDIHTLETVRAKVEKRCGKQGTMTGSLGYQGIVMDIHALQTETDKMRDDILTYLDSEIAKIKSV